MISLGTDVQSTVMILMADLEIITPRPEAAIFAFPDGNLGGIYRHIEWMKTVCTIPVITVSSGNNLYNDTMKSVGKSGTLETQIPVWMLDSRGNIGINKRECKLRNAPFLHRTTTPLREQIERLERIHQSGQQLPLFDAWGNECARHCGV